MFRQHVYGNQRFSHKTFEYTFFYKEADFFISSSEFLSFKFIQISQNHPTLPNNYMFKMLLRVKVFSLYDKILRNFKILEDSQKNLTQSSASIPYKTLPYKKKRVLSYISTLLAPKKPFLLFDILNFMLNV